MQGKNHKMHYPSLQQVVNSNPHPPELYKVCEWPQTFFFFSVYPSLPWVVGSHHSLFPIWKYMGPTSIPELNSEFLKHGTCIPSLFIYFLLSCLKVRWLIGYRSITVLILYSSSTAVFWCFVDTVRKYHDKILF